MLVIWFKVALIQDMLLIQLNKMLMLLVFGLLERQNNQDHLHLEVLLQVITWLFQVMVNLLLSKSILKDGL